jgi:hypothetical protein
MEKIIYVEEGIYIVQKQILRIVKGSDRDMRIWCANGEDLGYSEDYEKAKKEANRLNEANKNKNIRYVVNEIKELK